MTQVTYQGHSTSSVAAPVAAVAVQHLVKRYGPRTVLDNVSFTIQHGELFALLGPNGAGKTTTIEILEGYRHPDAGLVSVLGLQPHRQGSILKQRIGVVLQQGGIYPQATAREVLHLFASFYHDPADPDALLDQVGLSGVAKVRYRRLSGGQQRRLALAVALIGNPELVFLDEPTSGMDPQGRQLTWKVLEDLRQRGVTILLTTHYMEEAEQLADRIAIIDRGHLVALGTAHDLLQQTKGVTTLRVRLSQAIDTEQLQRLPGLQFVCQESLTSYRLDVVEPAMTIARLTAWLCAHNVVLEELHTGTMNLEELFLHLTGKELRE